MKRTDLSSFFYYHKVRAIMRQEYFRIIPEFAVRWADGRKTEFPQELTTDKLMIAHIMVTRKRHDLSHGAVRSGAGPLACAMTHGTGRGGRRGGLVKRLPCLNVTHRSVSAAAAAHVQGGARKSNPRRSSVILAAASALVDRPRGCPNDDVLGPDDDEPRIFPLEHVRIWFGGMHISFPLH
jgi:hypothetical protein